MRLRTKTALAAIVTLLLAATAGLFMLSSSPASAAVACAGHATVPELLVLHDKNGVPTGREALSIGTQTCAADEPISSKVCIKFQVYTGSAWYDLTTFRCTTNSGPTTTVSITLACSHIGNDLIRARTKATVSGDFVESAPYTTDASRPCA